MPLWSRSIRAAPRAAGLPLRSGRSPGAPAFTLLEVLIAIFLVGVLVAIALPSFTSAADREQLSESGARFKAVIAMCRAQSMNEARRYRILLRPDGTVRLERQLDAIWAPHVYVQVKEAWASAPVLLDRVWIAEVLDLPDGPPPFDVEDDLVEFDDIVEEPYPVTQLEHPLVLTFAPDGLSDSAQWLLRDVEGRGLRMTLDGRLGRVTVKFEDPLEAGLAERPEPIDYEEEDPLEDKTERELLAEYMP